MTDILTTDRILFFCFFGGEPAAASVFLGLRKHFTFLESILLQYRRTLSGQETTRQSPPSIYLFSLSAWISGTMMNFMKRERRNSSNKLDESGAPAKRHSLTFFPKKKSSDVASTGDDNSSSYESDDAPWRAGKMEDFSKTSDPCTLS